MSQSTISLLVLLATFGWFIILERRGRRLEVALWVLGVALWDAALYADTASATVASVLHPNILGQNFRLTQLVIPAALAARLIVSGFGWRSHRSAPLWLAFAGWIVVQTAVGLVQGFEQPIVLRQASVVIHVIGGLVVAGSVPAEDWARSPIVHRYLRFWAVVAAVLFVTDTLHLQVTTSIVPGLPFVGLGVYGADSATLFAALGTFGLVLTFYGRGELRTRVPLLLPSTVLLLSHLASPQRAARLGIYISVAVVLIACFSLVGRRRVNLRKRQMSFVGLALLAVTLVASFASALVAASAPDQTSEFGFSADGPTFGATARQGSIDSRYNQWNVVKDEILDHPILGEGLGKTFVHYDVGSKSFVENDIAHNVVLDLLRRTGVVGVLLGAGALVVTMQSGLATWRHAVRDDVAAVAMVASALVIGLLAKGMVESIFEKNRLAVLLGIVLGIVVSTALSKETWEDDPATVVPRDPAMAG